MWFTLKRPPPPRFLPGTFFPPLSSVLRFFQGVAVGPRRRPEFGDGVCYLFKSRVVSLPFLAGRSMLSADSAPFCLWHPPHAPCLLPAACERVNEHQRGIVKGGGKP